MVNHEPILVKIGKNVLVKGGRGSSVLLLVLLTYDGEVLGGVKSANKKFGCLAEVDRDCSLGGEWSSGWLFTEITLYYSLDSQSFSKVVMLIVQSIRLCFSMRFVVS